MYHIQVFYVDIFVWGDFKLGDFFIGCFTQQTLNCIYDGYSFPAIENRIDVEN